MERPLYVGMKIMNPQTFLPWKNWTKDEIIKAVKKSQEWQSRPEYSTRGSQNFPQKITANRQKDLPEKMCKTGNTRGEENRIHC